MSDRAELLKARDASIDADDDFDAINRLYMERGWGDGLPIIPPTAERYGVRADKTTRYGTIWSVVRTAKDNGMLKVGFVSSPHGQKQ